jgi:hypothetical protein
MNKRKTWWTVLLGVLCVPASAVGIILGYIVGCVIALVLRDILAPGASYEHYGIVALGPMAIGAALPWIAFGWYVARLWKRRRPKDEAGAEQDQDTQQESPEKPDCAE